MSRQQKIHKPIKGAFNDILAAVGMGSGKGKQAVSKLRKQPAHFKEAPPKRKQS